VERIRRAVLLNPTLTSLGYDFTELMRERSLEIRRKNIVLGAAALARMDARMMLMMVERTQSEAGESNGIGG
jgi:hypothetical protein